VIAGSIITHVTENITAMSHRIKLRIFLTGQEISKG